MADAPILDFNKLGMDAAQSEDLTKSKVFKREIPRAGIAMLRYVGYIETGKHMPKDPTHKPNYKCIHIFELHHPDHLIELEGGTKIPQRMFVHQGKGSTAKSAYRKLFSVMNTAQQGRYNHFIQMMGTAFLADIHHSDYKDTTYANLQLEGAWSLRAPAMVDVLTNIATPVPIPETSGVILGFLWENDNISDTDYVVMWDSLFIEGVRDDKSSKNWIQETIIDSMEWEGSRLQSLTEEFVSLDEPVEGGESTLGAMADMAQAGIGDDVTY